FTSTDPQAVLPANYTFTAGDSGSHTFTNGATLKTAGSQTITATDTTNVSISGSSSVQVNSAAPATHFSIVAPSGATAGAAFTLTVTALDANNNIATGYSDTVHCTSSDGLALLPPDSVLSSGVGSFAVTLETASSQTITATDTGTSSITGSASITVNPAAAARSSCLVSRRRRRPAARAMSR